MFIKKGKFINLTIFETSQEIYNDWNFGGGNVSKRIKAICLNCGLILDITSIFEYLINIIFLNRVRTLYLYEDCPHCHKFKLTKKYITKG
jgi:hypothetical protein